MLFYWFIKTKKSSHLSYNCISIYQVEALFFFSLSKKRIPDDERFETDYAFFSSSLCMKIFFISTKHKSQVKYPCSKQPVAHKREPQGNQNCRQLSFKDNMSHNSEMRSFSGKGSCIFHIQRSCWQLKMGIVVKGV